MRHVSLFLALGLLIGADDSKHDHSGAIMELEGKWQGQSAEDSVRKGALRSLWIVKRGKIIDTLDNRVIEMKYHLDLTKTPMEIDLIPTSGPAVGKTLKGIYKIEKEALTICYIKPSSRDIDKRNRPTEFEAKKRNDVIVVTFQRHKD